jgi:sarcosine/dimethylglycine N-methyltransferase
MPAEDVAIRAHYSGDRLAERILEALAAAGAEPSPQALAPADQFHSYGHRATRDLAAAAGLEPGERVLDLGCGLGGPARMLAAEAGCRVTGIDLTPEFIRSARILAEACGLADLCEFVEGTCLALPFDDASFDAVVTQHVVMNIADRARFWAEAFRVLRPGGRFACFDIIRGPNPAPLAYPLPWAREPAISHLLDEAATQQGLEAAGFRIERWEVVPPPPPAAFPPGRPLSLALTAGPDFPDRVRNAEAALADGRLNLLLAVLRKPA